MNTKEQNTNPLVTVGVITYNSSKYIIDTLNSVKDQTYPNIELVISDDCSTDNTPELAKKWIEENGYLFTVAKFISTPHNLGVAGNCNNAIRGGKGEWIKLLSGDDKFLPETVAGYMEYVSEHPEAQLCFGKFRFFSDNEDYYFHKTCRYYKETFYPLMQLPLSKQERHNLHQLCIPGPGTFFSRKLYELVGGFDEKYPFCEEDPFYGRCLATGHKIWFIDKELYAYNIRTDSLAHEGILSRHEKDRMRYFFDERFKRMRKKGMWFDAINQYFIYKSLLAKDRGEYTKSKVYTVIRRCSPYMICRYIEYRKGKRLNK